MTRWTTEAAVGNKRRGHGEGSIYYSESEGRWVAQVEAGVTASGRRRYLRRYRPTRTGAQDALADLLHQQDKIERRGLDIDLARQPLKTYLEAWLDDLEGNRAAKTIAAYRADIAHVTDQIGGVRLDKVTPQHVRQVLTAARGAGLAPKTVLNIRTTLHTAVEQAVKDQILDWNPVAVVDRPKVDRPDVTPLTVAEARTALKALADDRLLALYAVGIAVGLRLGEALGLTWPNIDLDHGIVRVRKQLQRTGPTGDRHYLLRDLKSKKSKGDVPLPDFAVQLLRNHRVRQAEERLAAGARWVDGCCTDDGHHDWDLVFTTNSHRSAGRPVHPSVALKHFQEVAEKAGVGRPRFHDLRHTAASLLLAQSVPLPVVQEILRHSSIQVTKDVYGHLESEHLRGAVGEMDALLG